MKNISNNLNVFFLNIQGSSKKVNFPTIKLLLIFFLAKIRLKKKCYLQTSIAENDMIRSVLTTAKQPSFKKSSETQNK